MDGFKLVGSVFANKSVDRSDRRPATEPSGAKRDRGAGYGSFARERVERGRPTTGPVGRSYEWSEAEMRMSSPARTDVAETSRGLGLAPSMGVSFSSASTTPVSHADLTPNFAAQELPHRATSGASSHAKSARMDIESSPLEETFVERPGSCSVNAGGAVAGNPVCLGCGATETPEWRRGPMGPRTLCNACGLVFAKLVSFDRDVRWRCLHWLTWIAPLYRSGNEPEKQQRLRRLRRGCYRQRNRAVRKRNWHWW